MTIHIDDWGTRRQYTSKVVQGTGGGGGGGVITVPVVTGPTAAGIGSTVRLKATASSLLAGGSVSSFTWVKPGNVQVVVPAVNGESSVSFTANGNDGDALTTTVYAKDNAGNKSRVTSHVVTLNLIDITNMTTNIPSTIVAGESVGKLSITGAVDSDGGSVTYDLTLPAGVTASKTTGLTDGELFSITAAANVTVNPTANVTITVTAGGGDTTQVVRRLAVVAERPTADEVSWTTPGSYTWTVPENVYSVCALTVDASGGDVSFGDLAVADGGFEAAARTLPSGNWYSITYGNGLFVAVSYSNNTAATSPDGIKWTARTLPAGNWHSITYGNGLFAAVGYNNNTAATSPDGINWTARTLPAGNWYSITYGNGLFVAVSNDNNTAATSPDGIKWTARTLPGGDWRSITYGNGLFAAVSYSNNTAATSPDGIKWTARTLPAGYWHSIAYGNGLFVAVSNDSTAATITAGPTATHADATLTSSNGFSLINPRNPGAFGLSNGVNGIAAYDNDIPTIPGSKIPVVVPPTDGGVRVIWGAGRSFPDNAGQEAPTPSSVDEVFAVRLYSAGDPASITEIDSDVNILNNAGIIWTKARRQPAGANSVYGRPSIHFRGPTQAVGSTTLSGCIHGNTTSDWYSPSNPIVVSNDGFTVNPASSAPVIYSNNDYVSYSFRRAAKFLDVVTFTVPVEGQSMVVSHSLKCEVGAIIVFKTGLSPANTTEILHWHRSKPNSFMRLNDSTINEGQYLISSTTDTTFTTKQGGNLSHVGTYTAMVFAHDPSSTGYIQCGMTNGNPTSTVELSWKPQFLMTIGDTGSGKIAATILDDRRQWTDSGDSLGWAFNDYQDDVFAAVGNTTATGFTTKSPNAVYIAIRGGSYTPPGNGQTHTLTGSGTLVVPSGVTNLIITGNGGLGVATTFSIPGNGQVTFAGSPSGVTTPPAVSVQNKAIPGTSKLVCTYNVPVGGSLEVKWLPWVESATHVLSGSGTLTIPAGVTSFTASGRGGPGGDGYYTTSTSTETYWGETKPGSVTYTRTWVPAGPSYSSSGGPTSAGDWVDIPTFHPAEYGWLSRPVTVSVYNPGWSGGNTTVSSVGGYADCIWYGSSNSATPPVVDQTRAIPAGANRVITYAVASGGSLTIKW